MYTVRESPPEEAVVALGGYDGLTQKLLYARGIVTAEDATAFFQREWRETDPYVYADMAKAAGRVVSAVGAAEPIGIYSDYDCDGIPAAAAMYSLLRALGHADIVYYVPDRNVQGFGLNGEGVRTMIDAGVSVVCVLDCGTSDPEHIGVLSDAGIDVIVVDHHLPGEQKPEPFAMINPTLEEVSEPHPCAAGLVFLLVQAVIDSAHRVVEGGTEGVTGSVAGGVAAAGGGAVRYGAGDMTGDGAVMVGGGTAAAAGLAVPKRGWEKWQLDIVALATLSDMVPLHGLNRQLVHYGLQVLRKSPRPGVQALCRLLKIDQREITQDDLSFMIIPRINAASRMGEARTAFDLLTIDDPIKAMSLANELTKLNDARKRAVAGMVRQANKQAAGKNAERKVWVFGSREWKPSLVGLVAQKLGETHGKTVFVWGQGGADGEPSIKGSCRSVAHDAFAMMREVSDLFLESGGHRQAGGFTLVSGAELVLEDRLNETGALTTGDVPDRCVDCECKVRDAERMFALSRQFEPFGIRNERITVAVPGVAVRRKIPFGKSGDHLRYVFFDDTGDIEGVAFFSGHDERHTIVSEGQKIRAVVGEPEWDPYRNQVRLRILDVLQ